MTDNGKQRPKMPVAQRAKQFMPFKAVAGLDEAIRKKEEELALAVARGEGPIRTYREKTKNHK